MTPERLKQIKDWRFCENGYTLSDGNDEEIMLDIIDELLEHVDALENRRSVLGGGADDHGPPYTHAVIVPPTTPLTPCVGRPLSDSEKDAILRSQEERNARLKQTEETLEHFKKIVRNA